MIGQVVLVLLVVFGAFAAIVAAARRTPILKDQLISQLPPRDQTYSLAKTQMAFWFLIILASTVYMLLFRHAALHDAILTPQTVALMGIALATAGAAVGVDHYRDTPEDSLNDALKAIGLVSFQDVVDMRARRDRLMAVAAGNPAPTAGSPPSAAQIAQAEINDLAIKLQFYDARTAEFRSEGFVKDLITNISGTALHRLQAVIWTIVIGGAFAWEVYSGSGLALPSLDDNLLTVMGISNAGYVGFKVGETNY